MHLVDTGLGPSFCSNERFDLFPHGLNVPGMGSQMIQGLRQDLKAMLHDRLFYQILADAP